MLAGPSQAKPLKPPNEIIVQSMVMDVDEDVRYHRRKTRATLSPPQIKEKEKKRKERRGKREFLAGSQKLKVRLVFSFARWLNWIRIRGIIKNLLFLLLFIELFSFPLNISSAPLALDCFGSDRSVSHLMSLLHWNIYVSCRCICFKFDQVQSDDWYWTRRTATWSLYNNCISVHFISFQIPELKSGIGCSLPSRLSSRKIFRSMPVNSAASVA